MPNMSPPGRCKVLRGAASIAILSMGVVGAAAQPPQTRQACTSDLRTTIDKAFAQVAKLQDMPSDKVYRLPVGGKEMSGGGDDFLRKRSGPEILASGYACGCGDYAVAFIHLLEGCGYRTLFVDSAEISSQSLQSRFSGHAVVAVRDEMHGRWLLADPTNRRMISDDWSPTDKIFYGNYWIGFAGPLASYPAHDPESLRRFYDTTLKSIPPDVLNERLFRFRFHVDPSLDGKDGQYLNPRLTAFLRDNGKFLEKSGLRPKREIDILLVKGDDDAKSRLTYTKDAGWVCTVGLRSALSSSFTAYMESTVANHELKP